MLTNYAVPYWNLGKRAFTGFQYAGYECENPFSKPLVRTKIYLLSCPAYWNPPIALRSGFQKPNSKYTSGFLKPASVPTVKSVSRSRDFGTAFSKVCIISKVSHRSSLGINFWISQELWNKKNVKTRSGPAESTNLNFKNLKYKPISGETVPLNYYLDRFYCIDFFRVINI